MKIKRMVIALVLGLVFGVICAYGTMMSGRVPEFAKTTEWLLTTVYNRVLIGLVIGLADRIKILKNKLQNAALRGGILGAVVTIGISFYGGAFVYIAAGIVYGIVIDAVATKFEK